jgi:hypothetical protein
MIPAYADVLSFKTDKTFYGKASTIVFSGTVEEDDYRELVTIVIADPAGKFAQLIQVFPDVDNKFQKSVDVSKLYTTAGIYNATAFITNKTDGISIDFDIEKQRPVTTLPELESEHTQGENDVVDTQNTQNIETNGDKTIQEKIKERIEAAKKLKELQTNPIQTIENTSNQTTNSTVTNSASDNEFDTRNNSTVNSLENVAKFDSNLLYVIAGLGSAGAAGAVGYSIKNKPGHKKYYSPYFMPEKTTITKQTVPSEDDYALMILKNRLAKGEITISEFDELKKALKEP